MSKLIGEAITVHSNKDSAPTAFIWRKRLYTIVKVLSWWREPSAWWQDKAVRLFLRVNARSTSTGTYELYRLDGNWYLHRILD